MTATQETAAGASPEREGRRGARIRAQLRAVLHGSCDRSRAQKRALSAFAIRIGGAAIAYASQVALARWMGGFEYGVFVFVWVWVLILGGLAPLGLNVAAIRFIPEHGERGELALLRGFLLSSRIFAFTLATLIALGAALVLYLAPGLVGQPYLLPAYLVLFCLPMYALVDIQDCFGRAYSWMGLALLPPYILRPLALLAAMALGYFAGFETTATTAAGAAVAATWLTGLVQLALLERRLRDDLPAGPRAYDARGWLTAALPIVLIEGFELLLQNTDILVIAHFGTAEETGIYFAALKTIGLVSFVHFAVGSAVANRISALKARGDDAGMRAFVRDAAHWTFWPSVLGAAVLLALGKPLLWMFGAGFEAAYPVMFILAAGFIVRAAMGPAEFVLNMLGKQNACAAVLFLTAALNLTLNFALVPVYGIYGAAAATSISLAIAAFLFYGAARRLLGLNIAVWQA